MATTSAAVPAAQRQDRTPHKQAVFALVLVLSLTACSEPEPVSIPASIVASEKDGDRVVVTYEIVNDTDTTGAVECRITSENNGPGVTLITPQLEARETREDDVRASPKRRCAFLPRVS
jgi:hypothetical protein